MKKFDYLMYAFAIAGSVFTISCNKDDNDDSKSSGKISAIVYKDYEGAGTDDSTIFIYNSNGLLTKVEEYEVTSSSKTLYYSTEFAYVNNNFVTATSYEWTGTTKNPDYKDSVSYDSKNRVIKYLGFGVTNGKFVKDVEDTSSISYGTNNLPSKYEYGSDEYLELEYVNNNVTEAKYYSSNTLYETNTYSYDSKKNPLKGNPYFLGEFEYFNTNNYLSRTDDYGSENLQYEYNDEDYPVKATTTYNSNVSKKAGTITSRHKSYSNKKAGLETYTEIIKFYYK
jgi:hypothetical protein